MQGDVYAQVEIKNIDRLTRLIEAYDNLGIVSTLDRNQGLVVIRGTDDTRIDLMNILHRLPFSIKIMDNFQV